MFKTKTLLKTLLATIAVFLTQSAPGKSAAARTAPQDGASTSQPADSTETTGNPQVNPAGDSGGAGRETNTAPDSNTNSNKKSQQDSESGPSSGGGW